MAGIGSCSETSVVFSGSKQFEADKYKHIEDNHFDRKSVTFWEEHVVLSDHGDMPKNWQSVGASSKLSLENVSKYHNRSIERIFFVTDNGGNVLVSRCIEFIYAYFRGKLGDGSAQSVFMGEDGLWN